VIPDGVASVTMHYPAEPPNGFTRKTAAAYTGTFKVIGNVLVARVPRAGSLALTNGTVGYRAPNGSVVKTINL
jgi:hypothetical protein